MMKRAKAWARRAFPFFYYFIYLGYLERKFDYLALRKYSSLDAGHTCRVHGDCTFEEHVRCGQGVKFESCSIGKHTFIADDTIIRGARIGRFCSIAPEVRIGLGEHPSREFVSTHPAFYSRVGQAGIVFADKNYFDEVKEIEIGNDVWIGYRAMIRDGVTIGDGAIIAAGAVVVKDVEPYSIVGGIPAKHIRYRFSPEQIAFLKEYRWWDRPDAWLQRHWKKFHSIDSLMDAGSS